MPFVALKKQLPRFAGQSRCGHRWCKWKPRRLRGPPDRVEVYWLQITASGVTFMQRTGARLTVRTQPCCCSGLVATTSSAPVLHPRGFFQSSPTARAPVPPVFRRTCRSRSRITGGRSPVCGKLKRMDSAGVPVQEAVPGKERPVALVSASVRVAAGSVGVLAASSPATPQAR